jgi:ankyrin repeat protein
MTNFYEISHNSFRHPWISKVISGADQYRECTSCHCRSWVANDLIAMLERSASPKRWPDIIGNGHMVGLRILSERCLEFFEAEGLGALPTKKVTIINPRGIYTDVPPYYVLIPDEIIGANVDLEKSGFVNARVCPTCKSIEYNYLLSDKKRNSFNYFPYVIANWKGTHIFSIENQTGFVFCTDHVIECARKYHLTNFRFVPDFLVHGYKSSAFRGIDYEKVKWRNTVEKWKDTEPFNQQPIKNVRSLPIHWVAGRVQKLQELTRRLEELGENVNLKDKDGETLLHWAAVQNPNVTILEYLISKGADINARNNKGMTPLHKAAFRNTVDHLKCLINAGAQIHIKDYFGYTIFHTASSYNVRIDVFEFLYHLNPDWINLKDINGMTPLHIATQYNSSPRILQFLIDHGADVDTCDNKNVKPLYYAFDDTKKQILLTAMETYL